MHKNITYMNFKSIEIGQALFKTLLIWRECSKILCKVYVGVCLAFWVKLCKKVLHLTLLSAGTKKKSVCGEEEIICIANNSLEVCLIGLAPSENAIARKFATVWVDAKKKIRNKSWTNWLRDYSSTGTCGLIEVFSITPLLLAQTLWLPLE